MTDEIVTLRCKVETATNERPRSRFQVSRDVPFSSLANFQLNLLTKIEKNSD
jgi:hypothetical protein